MLGRLINTVRHLGGASHFDSYVISLQRISGPGAPNRDEARRDYSATMRAVGLLGPLSAPRGFVTD